MTTDERFMALAVQQAREALGTTAPNPSVGAVLVRDCQVLGRGHTQPVGGPHAEVMALRSARDAGHATEGATMYVTLEPCRHVGRTPPCTRALRDAGVSRVVVGAVDPYPPMQGKGLDELRANGISVDLGLRAEACAELVRGFARVVRNGLPEVTLKLATSIDGRIATATGESQWITGPEARRDGHRLRASHDAIAVGIGTVLADDPRLTTREVSDAHPVPVVFDSGLRTPEDAKLLQSPAGAVIVCAEDAPERDLPARILRVPRGDGGLDIEAAMRAVAAAGLHRVLVEGGGKLVRSVLDARLADELVLYLGSVMVPGGLPGIAGSPLAALSDALRPSLRSTSVLGNDVVIRYGLRHRLEG